MSIIEWLHRAIKYQPEWEKKMATTYEFDLTDINAENWAILTDGMTYSKNPIIDFSWDHDLEDMLKYNPYHTWKNEKVTIKTSNHPVTGDYYDTRLRQNEVGFASHINLEGDEDEVARIIEFVKKHADNIKGMDE